MTRFAFAGTLVFLMLAPLASAETPWHRSLYLANDGYWSERLPVTVTNASSEPIAGGPLAVSIPELSGAAVISLRVCRVDGAELLFDLRDGRGVTKRAGSLSADDKLIVPIECPGHGAATVFVYANNAKAWAVPDFLPPEL